MMDKKGIPQYRCQRCACSVFDLNGPLVPFKTLETFIVSGPLTSEVNGTPRAVIHGCDDDGAGFAVIIGMMTEEHITLLRERMAAEAEPAPAPGNKSKSAAN